MFGEVEVKRHVFLTSVLEGGKWSASSSGALPPWGKSSRYPLDRRLGGSQSRSGRGGEEKEILAPAGNRTPVVQPVV